jgi:hypothetical protein
MSELSKYVSVCIHVRESKSKVMLHQATSSRHKSLINETRFRVKPLLNLQARCGVLVREVRSQGLHKWNVDVV